MGPWTSDTPPPRLRLTALGWLRAIPLGLALGLLVFGAFAVFLALRLVERPLCGLRRR